MLAGSKLPGLMPCRRPGGSDAGTAPGAPRGDRSSRLPARTRRGAAHPSL